MSLAPIHLPTHIFTSTMTDYSHISGFNVWIILLTAIFFFTVLAWFNFVLAFYGTLISTYSNNRDNRNSKDNRDCQDNRNSKDNRDCHNNENHRDCQDNRDCQDYHNNRDSKDNRDCHDYHYHRDFQDNSTDHTDQTLSTLGFAIIWTIIAIIMYYAMEWAQVLGSGGTKKKSDEHPLLPNEDIISTNISDIGNADFLGGI